MIPSYAVVPSYGRECLGECLEALLPQVGRVFLVQTREFEPPVTAANLTCLPWAGGERNISAWWNLGLDAAGEDADGPHDVLIINDDAIAPPHLIASLSMAMRAGTAALAYPAIPGREWITGWCFMLRGETGIRADPQFAWWYSDDDVCLQAKAAGGVARAYGCEVTHLHPGGHDQVMQAHTGADQELYDAKWDYATRSGTA